MSSFGEFEIHVLIVMLTSSEFDMLVSIPLIVIGSCFGFEHDGS